MELRLIRYFVTVAKEGNISRAAKRLHISQPALSRQIHAFEKHLGVALFERRGRGVRLTYAGTQLLPSCVEVLTRVAGLQARAESFASDATVVIRIGATPHFIESLVAPVLREFAESNSKIKIEFVECPSSRLAGLLEHGEIHLALGAAPAVSDFPTRALTSIPLTAVPPDQHPLQTRAGVEIAEVVAEPLLLLRRGYITRDLFESACQLAHVVPSVRHESDTLHTLLALVEAGVGVAIIQANAQFNRKAVPLTQNGKLLCGQISAAWNPHAYLPTVAVDLIDAVDAVIRDKVRRVM